MDDEEDRRANEPCDTLTLWNELQEDSVRNDRYCETKDRSIESMVKNSGLRWQLSAGGRSGKAEQSSYLHSYRRCRRASKSRG